LLIECLVTNSNIKDFYHTLLVLTKISTLFADDLQTKNIEGLSV